MKQHKNFFMASYIALKLSDSMMKDVNASIITIGDELLIGQTIDTNSAFIAQELNKIGIWVKRRIAIGDVREEIIEAIREQGNDCDVVIITGGLGPTADDITKPTLCDFFNSKLVVDQEALTNVINIFTALNRPLIERNLKQAEVPDNCIVLQNKTGTAPGMWWSVSGPSLPGFTGTEKNGNELHRSQLSETIYISLPGVPHEMKGMLMNCVIPELKKMKDLPAVVHRTLLTAGIGESMIAETISSFENNLPSHIRLAYLPAYGLVRLRLTIRSANKEESEKEIDQYFGLLKSLVQTWMIADEDITLQEAVSKLLRSKNKTLATAESCTGGYIAHMITSIPGSSEIYKGSVVSYAYEAKEDLLDVQKSTMEKWGAVSEQTVTEMITGILKKMKTDYAISTSGIMGPGGRTEEKPTGTVWIAVGNRQKTKTHKAFFRFNRERNIELTAYAALTMLYRFIIEQEDETPN